MGSPPIIPFSPPIPPVPTRVPRSFADDRQQAAATMAENIAIQADEDEVDAVLCRAVLLLDWEYNQIKISMEGGKKWGSCEAVAYWLHQAIRGVLEDTAAERRHKGFPNTEKGFHGRAVQVMRPVPDAATLIYGPGGPSYGTYTPSLMSDLRAILHVSAQRTA
jgi:hypothetical protein